MPRLSAAWRVVSQAGNVLAGESLSSVNLLVALWENSLFFEL